MRKSPAPSCAWPWKCGIVHGDARQILDGRQARIEGGRGQGFAVTAIEELALASIVRPEGAAPATLERAVRSACAGGWRAVEVVLAGEALRDRLAASEAGVRIGIEAVFGVFGRDVPTRSEALAALRRARRDGILDGKLDMVVLAAGCGRVGDAPAVAAGRRRVRALA